LIFNSEDILLERIRNEAKRFIKRKQLAITKPTVTSSTTITAQKDIPLFSIEQVSQIVEKMMKEREEALQEEYELKLSEKLSEQYSTFVKFTHEQIQKRFETSNFSYVS
jgi:glutamyl-tRNA reductase